MIMFYVLNAVVHVLAAGAAIYCIEHDEKYLAEFMVLALMSSAMRGCLRGRG